MLDVVRASLDDALIEAWRARIERAGAHLRWTDRKAVARPHVGGVLLAIAAPSDQLLLATEINEWALCAALVERDPQRWGGLEAALVTAANEGAQSGASPAAQFAPVLGESAALARFTQLSRLEAAPKMRALLNAAAKRALPYFVDDGELTLGAGAGSRTYILSSLPNIDDVPWTELSDIPTAIITGSNGKTTTVRLLAACARAHGWRAGYNCTDGVFIGAESLAVGDYSGPAGTRLVMRDRRSQAAILEAARGGILRRGLAVAHADVAVVTNVSSDHFGEYGIDDLAGLADVKLSVAAVIGEGLLVLNADDSLLRTKAQALSRRFGRAPQLAWFALYADQPHLSAYRAQGAATCGVRQDRLVLEHAGAQTDLGAIAAMPLSIGGIAAYNVANLAAAALAASGLGIPPATIASVFKAFGAASADNPGRMMRFEYRGAKVLIDYAHNPDGLRGLLSVAEQMRGGGGRLGLLLGHAGNRKDADIADLARVAAGFSPELIVIKEDEAHLRGRTPGEVPRIIRAELLRQGLAESALPVRDNELDAARYALDWARPGDVLALPMHSPSARAAVVDLLQR